MLAARKIVRRYMAVSLFKFKAMFWTLHKNGRNKVIPRRDDCHIRRFKQATDVNDYSPVKSNIGHLLSSLSSVLFIESLQPHNKRCLFYCVSVSLKRKIMRCEKSRILVWREWYHHRSHPVSSSEQAGEEKKGDTIFFCKCCLRFQDFFPSNTHFCEKTRYRSTHCRNFTFLLLALHRSTVIKSCKSL